MHAITKSIAVFKSGFMKFLRALSGAPAATPLTTSRSGEVTRSKARAKSAIRVVDPITVSPAITVTKKFAITGLGPAATKDSVQVLLDGFGPVVDVEIIRDGDAAMPIAIVEMAIGDLQAYRLTSRISNYWHGGHVVSANLLHH